MSAWSKGIGGYYFMSALVIPTALLGTTCPALAQDPQGQGQPQQQLQPQQQVLTQQQLQQLVAPIALYPDALLAQILTASTYPLEVAIAARWSEQNPNLKGAALEDAMQKQPWDPSVKGLTSVPQVLAMMNEKLDWTNQLGEAFLAQPNDIQSAIQALRKQAEITGNLKSSKEQKVSRIAAPPSADYVGPPEYIVIEPIEPDYIYVPVYDPVIVYGSSYWSPGYVPFFWYPPWWAVGPAFGFGAALFVGPALWYHYNWGYAGYAAIQTNTVLYSRFNRVNATGGGQFQNWKFNAAHHGNVPFKNTNLQRQFGSVGVKGISGVQTGSRVPGIQTGKNIQGVQTNKNLQGIQTNKNIQGVQTNRNIQGIQTNRNIQGVQTNRNIQGVQTNRNIQGVQTNRNIQGVQTNRNIQTGSRVQGMQTGRSIQGVQAGKGAQGSKKDKSQGGH